MSTTRAVWLFILVLTAIRLALLNATQLSPDEAYYWMWSQRPALSYFSKGAGRGVRHSLEHGDLWRQRIWRPLLESAPRRGHESAALLFCAALVQRHGRILDGGRAQRDPDLQPRRPGPDDRSALDFFWVAAFYAFWIALERSPNFSWWWPFTGLLIGLGFLCKFTNALELISILLVLALAPRLRRRISTAQSLPAARGFRALHDSADHLEFAARLDHAGPSQIARQPRRIARLSSGRAAFFSRRTFRDLFAALFSGWPGR